MENAPVNPFASIMAMLCNNKCWLCTRVFQRGKVKKVFMVSHLLRCLELRYLKSQEVSAAEATMTASAATVVSGGVEEVAAVNYITNAAADDNDDKAHAGDRGNLLPMLSPHLIACFDEYCRLGGDTKMILQRLKDIECDTWMSGLICGTTQACAQDYLLLVPDGKVTVPKIDRKSDEECPPGCDCDNPWAYVAEILKTES